MSKHWAFILSVVATIGLAAAVTEEEKNNIQAVANPILTSCGSELGVSKEAVLAAKETQNPDDLPACFYACFLKKLGNVINDEGMFDAAASNEVQRKYIHGADDISKLEEITKTCSSINDKAVSDGAKGCERAKLFIICMTENKSSFNPFE